MSEAADTPSEGADASSSADAPNDTTVPEGCYRDADGCLRADETDNPLCGSTDTSSGKPCEILVSEPEDTCHLHDGDGVPDDWGKPEGIVSNPTGYAGGQNGAPEGNFNSVEHGADMDAERRLDYIREEGREDSFRRYVSEYSQKAENPSAAVELAAAAVLRDMIEEDLIRQGLWEEIPVVDERGEQVTDPETGEPVYRRRIRESDLSAYKQLMTELRLSKDYEGITNNDDVAASGHGNASLIWDTDAEAVQMTENEAGDVDFQPVKDV